MRTEYKMKTTDHRLGIKLCYGLGKKESFSMLSIKKKFPVEACKGNSRLGTDP